MRRRHGFAAVACRNRTVETSAAFVFPQSLFLRSRSRDDMFSCALCSSTCHPWIGKGVEPREPAMDRVDRNSLVSTVRTHHSRSLCRYWLVVWRSSGNQKHRPPTLNVRRGRGHTFALARALVLLENQVSLAVHLAVSLFPRVMVDYVPKVNAPLK